MVRIAFLVRVTGPEVGWPVCPLLCSSHPSVANWSAVDSPVSILFGYIVLCYVCHEPIGKGFFPHSMVMNMGDEVNILGFAGSLRKDSYNKALLLAAKELLPKDARLEIFDLGVIPLFNQDLEARMPEKVSEFKAKIRAADAILIATPEYNYSMSGVLKNAIDWASRPYGDNSFEDKPVAVMSASVGMLGGSRAQYHLRQVFVFLNMHPVNRPEVMVPMAADRIDAKGVVTDKMTRGFIKELLESLVILARKFERH